MFFLALSLLMVLTYFIYRVYKFTLAILILLGIGPRTLLQIRRNQFNHRRLSLLPA